MVLSIKFLLMALLVHNFNHSLMHRCFHIKGNYKALLIFTLVDGLVRLDTYNLYRAGPLYNELIDSCRTMLENKSR